MGARPGGNTTQGWRRVLLAPAVGLVRPREAAGWMAAAPRSALLLVTVLSLLIYAVVLIFLMLWEGTVRLTWVGMGVSMDVGSFASVWAEWQGRAVYGWLGPAELTLILVLLLGPLLVAVLSWLSLPFVHRTDSVGRAYARAMRAIVVIFSPITVATAACGAIFVVLEHGRRGPMITTDYVEPGLVLFFCIAISLCLLAGWLHRAIAGVGDEVPSTRSPLCEGCGYDLTHQPTESRCPECGLAITASLDAERSRPGCPWARQKSGASWRSTSQQVLARPGLFYRRLQLRTPMTAEAGFAVRHYVWIALGAALWAAALAVVLSVREGPPAAGERVNLALGACAGVLSGVFGCWLGQRAIGALVVTWWLARKALPDTQWAAKVIVYETTFLWVFCLFWGLLLGSYALAGPWISHLIGPQRYVYVDFFFILGIPIELWTVAVGTLTLAGFWLWRYGVAYRSVRWSNF